MRGKMSSTVGSHVGVSLTSLQFLGKSLPDEPFPKTNDPVAFSQSVNSVIKPRFVKAIRNMILVLGSSALLVAAIGLGIRNGGWRWIKLQFSTLD